MVINPSMIPVAGIDKLVTFDVTSNLLKGYTTKQNNIFGSIVHEMLKKFIDDKNILDEEAARRWAVPLIENLDKNYIDRLNFILWSYNKNKTIKNKDIKEIFKEELIKVKVGDLS